MAAKEIQIDTQAATKGLADINSEMSQLVGTTKELDKAVDDLGKEYKDGAIDAATYSKRLKDITSSQNKNNKSISDATKKQKALQSQLKKTAANSKQAAAGAGNLAGQFGGPIGSAIVSAISGFRTLGVTMKAAFASGVSGARLFKIALASTGIGLLVVAIASLAAWFTTTERGAQALRVIMAQVDVVIGEITDTLAGFVDKSIEASSAVDDIADSIDDVDTSIKNIKEEVKSTGEEFSILKNIVNSVLDVFRVVAWVSNKINESIELAKISYAGFLILMGRVDEAEALLGTIGAFARKLEESAEIQKGLNTLRVEERESLLDEQKILTRIGKLKNILANTSKTAAERVAAGTKAQQLIVGLTNTQIDREVRKLQLLQNQAELNESDEETKDAIVQQELKIEGLLTAQEKSLRTILTTTTNITSSIDKQVLALERSTTLIIAETGFKLEQLRIDALSATSAEDRAVKLEQQLDLNRKILLSKIEQVQSSTLDASIKAAKIENLKAEFETLAQILKLNADITREQIAQNRERTIAKLDDQIKATKELGDLSLFQIRLDALKATGEGNISRKLQIQLDLWDSINDRAVQSVLDGEKATGVKLKEIELLREQNATLKAQEIIRQRLAEFNRIEESAQLNFTALIAATNRENAVQALERIRDESDARTAALDFQRNDVQDLYEQGIIDATSYANKLQIIGNGISEAYFVSIKARADLNLLLYEQSTQLAAAATGFAASLFETGTIEWKLFASIQAGINATLATIRALATGGPIAAAATAVAGAAMVAQILAVKIPTVSVQVVPPTISIPSPDLSLFQSGGFTGFGAPNEEAGIVHKGEYVVPAPVLNTTIGSQLVAGLEGLRTGSNIPQQGNIADQVVAGLRRSPIFVRVKDIVDESNSYVKVIDSASY